MMQRLLDFLAPLNSRVVSAVMLLLAALLAFEGWMLVLRKPLTTYEQSRVARVTLADSLHQSPDASIELKQVTGELQQLSDKLSGQLHVSASDDEIAASLIAALDQSASRHGLTLSSVVPGERKQVSVFEEVPFEVSANGPYLQLAGWILDFENTLGHNTSVTEFDMKTAGQGDRVNLSLRIALYRPLARKGVSP